jgi:hypothetical protein
VREGLDRVDQALGEREDEVASELRELAEEVGRGLDTAASADEVNRYRRNVGTLAGSYDRPTEGQTLALRRMEEALDALETALNDFLAGPVADFRRRVEAADIDLFPDPGRVGR